MAYYFDILVDDEIVKLELTPKYVYEEYYIDLSIDGELVHKKSSQKMFIVFVVGAVKNSLHSAITILKQRALGILVISERNKSFVPAVKKTNDYTQN